ncbi:uncharacterized protein LOC116052810 [Sander lucioperca]|uniref:uncharacterized protein LOC116052810 n=1 Tax=Sander lucioperca TaxID=283035 RepID=UPI0016536E3D|nr:uncharacterized protein LOC116052810 [Sander lucioperca]
MELLPLLCLCLLTRSGITSVQLNGAAPEPSVKILNLTNNSVLLQCEVQDASPDLKVELQDSAGNTLPAEEPQVSERGDRYYITLQTTVFKTDNFSCVVTQEETNQQIYAQTFVHISGASPEPYIRTLKATADWALLQCEVRRAAPKPRVEWKDSAGNTLPAEEPQTSERGGSYYITLITTVTKTDNYSCVVTQEEISHQTHAETFVLISGASPEPYIRTLKATAGWDLLQCEVRRAAPKPKVEWQDSAGNTLPAEETWTSERGGSYYTLITTVTKTDNYSCVVTQEEISHQTQSETFVHISGKVCEDSSGKVAIGWMIVALVLGVLIVVAVAVLVLLVLTKIITIRCNRGSRQQGIGLREQENGLVNQGNGLCEKCSELLHSQNGR